MFRFSNVVTSNILRIMLDLKLEPFNKYFMLNFSNLVKSENIEHDLLRRLWRCEWVPETIQRKLNAWIEDRQTLEKALDDEGALRDLLCEALELGCIFVQVNFCGPPLEQIATYQEIVATTTNKKYDPFERLMESSEELNPNVRLGEMLVIAKEIVDVLIAKAPKSIVLHWWKLRFFCLQQQLLGELAGTLWDQVKVLTEVLLPNSHVLQDAELETLLHLECANAHVQFRSAKNAEDILTNLSTKLHIEMVVEGLMGMRTRFQNKALPQLCLKVIQKQPHLPTAVDTNGGTILPRLLLHEDDTRLERIQFVNESDNEVMTVPSVLQALVLCNVKHLRRSQPKDRLRDEQLEPYLQTLLYQTNGPFAVRQAVLLMNCMQESDQRRTVERSWKQCEECLKMVAGTRYTLPERLSYGFATMPQPRWHIEAQFCEILLSLGMIKTALELYLGMQAWQEVIFCYTRLELRHKAREYIEQELARKPTVLLHILMGDVTDDPTHYERAWKFSGERSARAQAYWGHHHFQRGEYEQAIQHYTKSTEINTLQETVWLRLGYSAIKQEKWSEAVRAYITYTHLEPLGFESWNNLAKALIKLGDKTRAYKMLSEALKCNYNNWKIWENFLLVSFDTNHFEDALNAYARLGELKDRYIDLEVLSLLVNAIVTRKPDANNQTHERLEKKAIQLLAHECMRHKNESKLWELAALLARTPLNKAQKLVRAYSALTVREGGWTSMQPFALQALKICKDVCTLSLEAIGNHSEDEGSLMINSQLNSARLTAQSCIYAVEKNTEKWPENECSLEELKSVQKELLAAIEAHKSKDSSTA